MVNADPVLEIEIPEYITHVQLSKSRRKKYYKKGKKRPKKYQKEGYTYDKKGWLRDPDGNRVVSNPRAAGTPKMKKLSGNAFSTGFGSPHVRHKLVKAMKSFFSDYVEDLEPLETFPLRVEWEMHIPVDPANFDMSNFWFYYKYFEDTLVSCGIIPDDNIKYITSPGAPLLVPVDDEEDRKFIFRLYHDTRPVITSHDLWQTNSNTHGNTVSEEH